MESFSDEEQRAGNHDQRMWDRRRVVTSAVISLGQMQLSLDFRLRVEPSTDTRQFNRVGAAVIVHLNRKQRISRVGKRGGDRRVVVVLRDGGDEDEMGVAGVRGEGG